MAKKTAIEAIHNRLVSHFGSTKNRSILDYGCGKGGLTRILLHQEKRHSHIYAVDSNPAMIAAVDSSFPTEISKGILKTDVISDPIQITDYSCDGIFCHNVLELIEHKEQFIENLYNLFNDNGIFILSHMDFDSMIYHSSYKELTRKLIHHFADTQQAWMKTADGQMGRKIPGILQRAQIHDFSFETWRWTETTFQENDYGFIMATALLETAATGFEKNELQDWKNDLIQKVKSEDYIFAIDIDVARIKKGL